MKYLADANLSRHIAGMLRDAGFEADHVIGTDLWNADDETISDLAIANGQTVISADSDFATILALRKGVAPSLVLLRSMDRVPPAESFTWAAAVEEPRGTSRPGNGVGVAGLRLLDVRTRPGTGSGAIEKSQTGTRARPGGLGADVLEPTEALPDERRVRGPVVGQSRQRDRRGPRSGT